MILQYYYYNIINIVGLATYWKAMYSTSHKGKKIFSSPRLPSWPLDTPSLLYKCTIRPFLRG
jgi:hypothetical protein